MRCIPLIRSVMTPFPHSVDVGEPIAIAKQVMADLSIRHLPVMEDGRLIDVISDRDLKLALDPSLGLPPEEELVVRDVCLGDAYVVNVTARLDYVLLEMAKRHIGSALVVKERKLVGIFTTTDACRQFGDLLQSLFPTDDEDLLA
jgi:CBS domain-containing protein